MTRKRSPSAKQEDPKDELADENLEEEGFMLKLLVDKYKHPQRTRVSYIKSGKEWSIPGWKVDELMAIMADKGGIVFVDEPLDASMESRVKAPAVDLVVLAQERSPVHVDSPSSLNTPALPGVDARCSIDIRTAETDGRFNRQSVKRNQPLIAKIEFQSPSLFQVASGTWDCHIVILAKGINTASKLALGEYQTRLSVTDTTWVVDVPLTVTQPGTYRIEVAASIQNTSNPSFKQGFLSEGRLLQVY